VKKTYDMLVLGDAFQFQKKKKKAYCRVEYHNLHRPIERFVQYFRHFELGLVDFSLRFQIWVSGKLSETSSAADENIGRRSLRKEEEHAKEDRASKPEDLP
jgi:hypothetical protein